MQRLRQVAFQSVGRAVGFATLGITCLMLGLSFDPLLALRAGGLLVLGVLAVLLFKMWLAGRADYRRSEAWLLLDPSERPPDAYAAWAMRAALTEAYNRFARWTAGAAVVLWALAVLVGLAGLDRGA